MLHQLTSWMPPRKRTTQVQNWRKSTGAGQSVPIEKSMLVLKFGYKETACSLARFTF